MLSVKSKVTCFLLAIFVLLGCGVFPSFACLAPMTAGCASSGNDWKNNENTGSNTEVPVIPVYDTTDVNSYNMYFGKLNSHSSQSDGALSLDGAFKYARDIAKLDFFAITDNSDMFDNGAGATLANGNVSSKWITGKAAAEYYTGGKFVGIYGFEMAWVNGNGHMNTYNTEGFETSTEAAYAGSSGLNGYYNALKQYPASLSQFNHPGNGGATKGKSHNAPHVI